MRVLTLGTILDFNTPGNGRDYAVLKAAAGIPGFLNGLGTDSSNKCSRPGASGAFFKLNADYDLLQKLPKDTFFFFHATGQWSPNKLTIPEQLYIGGIDTVRGFPLAVALGDSGYYWNLEFRMPPYGWRDVRFFKTRKTWKDVLQFAAFVDQGGVFLKSSTDTFLWGSGLGVIINGPYSLALTLTAAVPLNHRDRSRDVFFYVKITGIPF